MKNVRNIVERFGGLSAMARALGHKHPTTIQGWRDKDRIPHWRWDEVKKAARRKKIKISDLFAEPAE
ncbi:carph-isopro domain-containing protein [Cohaesibacter gelatinilyticus]